MNDYDAVPEQISIDDLPNPEQLTFDDIAGN